MNCKSILVITIFLLFSHTLFSQEFKPSFGVTAGINISYISQKGNTESITRNPTSLFGLNVGAVYRRAFSNTWAIRPELHYIMKGGDFGTVGVKQYHYLNLPLIVQYSPDELFQIEFGLEPAALIGVGNNFLGKYPFITKWDLSALIGVSYLYQEKYEFAVRYGHGFIPVEEIDFTNANGQPEGTLRDLNRYVKISFGYYFEDQEEE